MKRSKQMQIKRETIYNQVSTMKLSDAICKVRKITDDCADIKDSLSHLENYDGVETMVEFIARCSESKRISVELLLSTLILLEEELRMLLDSEITIKEVPGE